jgi:hypothetical protein
MTGFTSLPIFSISISTTFPGAKKTGGLRVNPTPYLEKKKKKCGWFLINKIV